MQNAFETASCHKGIVRFRGDRSFLGLTKCDSPFGFYKGFAPSENWGKANLRKLLTKE